MPRDPPLVQNDGMRVAIHGSRILNVFVVAAFASPAFALSPSEVFEKAAPSVVGVRSLDAQGKPLAFGSAVAIGSGKLVTSCHVLARANKIELLQEGSVREATLEQADVQRDLCVISAPGLAAPAAAVAAQPAKIGQRVYAIGVPSRLDVSLAEGMVSGTRSADPGLPPLQTTAPLSPGQSGGGLFNEQAQLLGITTLNVARGSIATNINFAQPAAWIAEIGARSEQQLAERRLRQAPPARTQAAAGGMPAPGTRWRYTHRDEKYNSPQRAYTVEVVGVEGSQVRERFAAEGAAISESSIDGNRVAFIARPAANGSSIIELAPYAPALHKRAAETPDGYPRTAAGAPWQVSAATYAEDRVTVPAGTFTALRVEVNGTASTFGSGTISSFTVPARFTYTAWYAPEVNRYLKVRHQLWNPSGASLGDEVMQLVEYRPQQAAQQAAVQAAPAGVSTFDLEPIVLSAAAPSAPGSAASPRTREAALKAVVLNVTGGSAATGSEDWEKLKAECVKQLSTSSERRGSKFSVQDGEPRALKESGTLVAMHVNSFNYVSPGARAMGGSMAGKATVDAKVRFLDLQTGAQISEATYAVSSADLPGIGMFSAASNRVLEELAEQILKALERP